MVHLGAGAWLTPTTERDSAATALAAPALPELAQGGPEVHRARYRDFAEVTVEALTARHLTASVVLADARFNKRPDGRRCMSFTGLTRI